MNNVKPTPYLIKDISQYVFCVFQNDTDFDLVGDECDNCPTDYNPNQEDTDKDNTGDACEDDLGISALNHENFPF